MRPAGFGEQRREQHQKEHAGRPAVERNFEGGVNPRPPPPPPPISRYIGTNSASKKMKKTIRSSARNVPSTAVSSTSIAIMYRRTSVVTVHEASTDTGNKKVVSSTSHRLMPSTPTIHCNPMLGSHEACSTSWNPGSL